jgi:hypothetical protein
VALLVIGRAYQSAFTKRNIQSAFRKTGIWPFSRKAIDVSLLAPSETTSTIADAPNPLPTVVKKVTRALEALSPIRAPNFGVELSTTFSSNVDDNDKASNSHINVISVTPNDSPTTVRAQKYAVATRDALVGTSLQHIISETPASSSDLPPPLTIVPALHLRLPNFDLINEQPDEDQLTGKELCQLTKALRLELDLARLHLNELDSTVITYQAELVLSDGYGRRQQRQLYAHESKRRQKDANVVIKPDGSKGRVISCKEAEAYERERHEAEQRQQEEKRAKEARIECEAFKLRSEAEKLARKRRRDADLEQYGQELVRWEATVANWGRGRGRKPVKPVKPKVRKDPLSEAELAEALAILQPGSKNTASGAAESSIDEEEIVLGVESDCDDLEGTESDGGLGSGGDSSEEGGDQLDGSWSDED